MMTASKVRKRGITADSTRRTGEVAGADVRDARPEADAAGASSLEGIAVSPPTESLDRRLVLLLAVTCGAAVANLYYAQPLLDVIAATSASPAARPGCSSPPRRSGTRPGCVLLVPLGDLLDRRRMVARMLLLSAAAPRPWRRRRRRFGGPAPRRRRSSASPPSWRRSSSRWPATLARRARARQGRRHVMSGLLLGILLARTAAGLHRRAGRLAAPSTSSARC